MSTKTTGWPATSSTTFQPEVNLTRAMAAQVLYNLEGQPAVTGDTTFTDAAAAGEWAVKAITWAEQTGVVAGIGDGLFDPTANVTREEFAQMMYNYASYKEYDLTLEGDLSQFEDASAISSWAETAMSWANGSGLINGHDDGTIDPQGTTTRAPGCQHPHELRPERRGKLKQNPGGRERSRPLLPRPGKSTRCHFPGNPQAKGRPTHRRRGAKSALQNHSPKGKPPAAVNRPRLCGQYKKAPDVG